MRLLRWLSLVVAWPLSGQVTGQGTRADSLRADSAQRLRAVTVQVTRLGDAARESPWSVARAAGDALHRGRPALGLDEALPALAGVIVQNRYNYSVDQRIAIRGAGSRANFGVRGVKVLLDGIPQSLPDGQNQLSNIDLAAVGAVDALRGSASTLYGNGSGGVLSFQSDLSRRGPLDASVRVLTGSSGMARTEARVAGGQGATTGAITASRLTLDGFRQHSAADVRQLNAAVDHDLGDGRIASLRLALNETPRADNPGALTAVEYAANPDSAAGVNLLRGARRAISQRQLSLRLHREVAAGWGWSAAAYGIRRLVDNPLATSPPGGGAVNGTLSLIDRRVTGLRFDGTWRAASVPTAMTAAIGIDMQRAFDVRRNYRDTRGARTVATDSLFLWQDEETIAIGPFVQGAWSPLGASGPRVSAGVRHDRVRFAVADQFLADGGDNGGHRTMAATSGQLGAVWAPTSGVVLRANASTAFETPTTTELNAREDGRGGFNDQLRPQQQRMLELGAHLARSTRLEADVAIYAARAHDAIVPYASNNGRTYFRNAGRTRTQGAEFDVQWVATRWLRAHAAWTWTDARFVTYRVGRGAAVDTLDGHRLAGIPSTALRLGVEASHGAWFGAADLNNAGALWADDAGTQRVAGWRTVDLRASWRGEWRGLGLEPLAGVTNVTDRRYIGAVTINGTGGRTLEPAAPRQWYLGVGLRHARASH